MASSSSNDIRAQRALALEPGLRRQMLSAAIGMSDVIGLGRGDPDIETPGHIVEAAKAALDAGYTHYAPYNGYPALRRAVAEKFDRENAIRFDPDAEILITGGAQEAVFIAMQVAVGPGDEVMIPDPHYSSYDASIRLAGAQVIPVPTHESDDFVVSIAELERHVTPRSRMLVVVNPGNPTGYVLPEATLREIAEFAIRHDLLVISDEIYEKFIYVDTPHVSLATLPGMRERTITVNSLSKTYAMTGWRIGYMGGPRSVIEAAGELKYALSICAPSASQMAGVAALQGPQDHIRPLVEEYGIRRRIVLDALDAIGLTYGIPEGGFTVMANIQPTHLGSVDFCLRVLREAQVQVFPGLMYGPSGEGYVRISFLAEQSVLMEALRRIGRLVHEMRADGPAK